MTMNPTWDELTTGSTTWDEFTFNDPTTTWAQVFSSYVITDPGIEVVTDLYGGHACTEISCLPTIVVYDTSTTSNAASSENTNVISLLNKSCPINLTWVERVYIVLPDNTYLSSQTLPAQIYWDDWFVYLQLGKNDLWDDIGEGYIRTRLLIKMTSSSVPFFWGFLRIKILLGGEVI